MIIYYFYALKKKQKSYKNLIKRDTMSVHIERYKNWIYNKCQDYKTNGNIFLCIAGYVHFKYHVTFDHMIMRLLDNLYCEMRSSSLLGLYYTICITALLLIGFHHSNTVRRIKNLSLSVADPVFLGMGCHKISDEKSIITFLNVKIPIVTALDHIHLRKKFIFANGMAVRENPYLCAPVTNVSGPPSSSSV